MHKRNTTGFRLASTLAAVLAGLAAATAQALPLPANFTSIVAGGGTTTGVCGSNTGTDGICTAANGSFAHTDGGVVGTPGYDPSLRPGTSVSVAANGFGTFAYSQVTYYFEVGGPPIPTQYNGLLAVDILSSGIASLTGSGFAFASLLVTDMGSDADIAPNTPDPDKGLVLDNRYDCVGSGCILHGVAWTQTDQFSADHLCLTQGDMYAITITTGSSIGSRGGSGSASVDPQIIVDPQGPTDPKASCYQPGDPLSYQAAISISPGTSTGVAVPEPGTLGLLGLGLAGLGLARRSVRRSRQAI
jgi:hypothetical protein